MPEWSQAVLLPSGLCLCSANALALIQSKRVPSQLFCAPLKSCRRSSPKNGKLSQPWRWNSCDLQLVGQLENGFLLLRVSRLQKVVGSNISSSSSRGLVIVAILTSWPRALLSNGLHPKRTNIKKRKGKTTTNKRGTHLATHSKLSLKTSLDVVLKQTYERFHSNSSLTDSFLSSSNFPSSSAIWAAFCSV